MKSNNLLIIIILALSLLIALLVVLPGKEGYFLHPGGIEKGIKQAGEDQSDYIPENPPSAGEAVPGQVLNVEERIMAPAFPVSLLYDKYITGYTYIFVESESADIYSGPSREEGIIGKARYGERLDYLETVYVAAGDGSAEEWFHVLFEKEAGGKFGFVSGAGLKERWYQFDKMEKAIAEADACAENDRLTYISNYQNKNGYAPLYKGMSLDGEGNRRSQSAPGYKSLSDMEDFVYIGDGTLVQHLLSEEDYAKVKVVATGEEYYVPLKYIPADHFIHNLTRVIAVDVSKQNEAVFEKKNEGWTLISYTQATSGTKGRYAQPTPVGLFFAMEKKPYFRYYEDGTTNIQGYAPYAIRFAGGAYIHGIPVNYKYGADGTLVAPPHQEYSKTIGTVPLSHKCVRNYTSHAKFLYDWFIPGETIIIVID
ncbi:hypothetical protein MASR2M70_11000 [Bacillota bacterium]